MGRQEDVCWRCGARVRHVRLRGRHAHDPLRPLPSGRVTRRRAGYRSASRPVAALEVRGAGRADPLPSRAEEQARWQSDRLDAERRRKQALSELAAAIEVGDAAYRRLRERLDDFSTRLALVRLTLSAPR